ncbi:hypothetical protein CQ059_22725 [Brucella pseudogrignonensis]|nr:hypothetical protein [Ochrobactrum sp. MYb237]PQZ39409.1 hypothetical protein CQ059_22725 [Brucella pseudogrignonensis]PRA41089.1 hypothetical protein CQ063_11315 [Brucella pseudogrignonensis]PRA69915.1 hypothetical protein CQ055_11200 [Brucella pseudogrignonensis]
MLCILRTTTDFRTYSRAMPSTLSLHDYDLTLRDINAICREALNRDRLSFDSDFFALGADSLTLVEIQLLIEDKFGIAVDWRDILRCRSVSSLAYFLCSRDYQDAQPHKQAAFNGVTFCYRVIGSLNANSVPKLIIGGGFQDMYSLPHLESLLASDGPLIFVDVPGDRCCRRHSRECRLCFPRGLHQ